MEKEPSEHRAGRVRILEIEHKQIEKELRDLYARESSGNNISLKIEQATAVEEWHREQRINKNPLVNKDPMVDRADADGQPGPQGQRGQQGQ